MRWIAIDISLITVALIMGIVLLVTGRTPAHADTYVQGYTRQNGTYVQPHYRSDPNGTRMDNWSTRGNVNPYTLERGTTDPYGGHTPNGNYLTPKNAQTNHFNELWSDENEDE